MAEEARDAAEFHLRSQEATDDAEDADLSRDEVEAGITVLEKWATAILKPSTLKRKGVACWCSTEINERSAR